MHCPFIRGGLLATLGLALTAVSQAETGDSEALRRMSPQHAKAWVLKQIERQKARPAALAGDLDVTAPSFVVLDSRKSVDVTVPLEFMSISFKSVDDMSGFRDAYAYAVGPSGHAVSVAYYGSVPSKKVSGLMTSYQLSPFLEPGTYTFVWGYASDVAGNYSFLDPAALANTTFTVKNTKGFDVAPPALQSGKVLTPQVSLSARQPGTDRAGFVGLALNASDSGTTVVAGVRYAYANFCLADTSNCFSLWANDTGTPRREGSTALRLGGQVDYLGGVPGEYHLNYLLVADYADNTLALFSTEFGGSTDFSTYFPSTTITVTP
jgi:hypothetical protein